MCGIPASLDSFAIAREDPPNKYLAPYRTTEDRLK